MTQATLPRQQKAATAPRLRPQAPLRFIVALSVATIAWTTTTPGLAQRAYANPDAAAQALHDAVARDDAAALRSVLGPDWKRFVPTGQADRSELDAFMAGWEQSHRVEPDGDGRAVLAVGDTGWLLPIPLVERKTGWQFAPADGADLMRTRRIRDNQLAAMQGALA